MNSRGKDSVIKKTAIAISIVAKKVVRRAIIARVSAWLGVVSRCAVSRYFLILTSSFGDTFIFRMFPKDFAHLSYLPISGTISFLNSAYSRETAATPDAPAVVVPPSSVSIFLLYFSRISFVVGAGICSSFDYFCYLILRKDYVIKIRLANL